MIINDKLQIPNKLQSNQRSFCFTFLHQLQYWTQRGQYGIEKDGRIWIYNTLDSWSKQLKCSKSTTQRIIRDLKGQGIIDSAYLSYNKRNRTLFYSINYDKFSDVNLVKNKSKTEDEDHMFDHMYYKDNNNKINKSYKSSNSFFQKNSDVSKPANVEKSKNTTIQDMLKTFNSEFSDISVRLDKNLSRNLVAAFKLKFEGSLEKWNQFLKLIKTSTYLMSEKFKLSLHWLLKFSTIDRLKLGELGVKINEFFTNDLFENDWRSKVEQQIAETDDCEKIKTIRRKIAEKITPAKYMTWFKNVKFLQKNKKIELIYPNRFIEDAIKTKFFTDLSCMALVY